MASETTVQRTVWLALAARLRTRATLFRSNSGKGWISGGGPVVKRTDGTAMVPNGRPIALGLALANGDTVPGLSDLTGWTDVVITPEMVGRRVPVFTVVETKATGGGRKRENQINFVRQVQKAGGIAGFAESERQAHEIIDAWVRGDTPDPL
jgi:hypothetical protein